MMQKIAGIFTSRGDRADKYICRVDRAAKDVCRVLLATPERPPASLRQRRWNASDEDRVAGFRIVEILGRLSAAEAAEAASAIPFCPGTEDDEYAGMPLAHIAASRGLLRCLSVLHRKGARLDTRCMHNEATPLEHAVCQRRAEVAAWLARKSSDPEDLQWVLVIALGFGPEYAETARALLANGADPDKPCELFGKMTPAEAAQAGGLVLADLLPR